jgi:hypothetical protein
MVLNSFAVLMSPRSWLAVIGQEDQELRMSTPALDVEAVARVDPESPRLCRLRLPGDRQLTIQHRPIGAPRVTAALASKQPGLETINAPQDVRSLVRRQQSARVLVALEPLAPGFYHQS